MSSQNVILFGGGGAAVEIARYIKDRNATKDNSDQFVVTDLVDRDGGRIDDLQRILGHSFNTHASIDTVENFEEKRVVNTLGLLPVRNQQHENLIDKGARLLTVVHPTAHVSPTAELGAGCIIAPFSLVGEFAKLGPNVTVNVGVTIGHDVSIGQSSVLSPNVAICGGSTCGDGVYFGVGVTVNPGIEIGAFCKLSSGAVITAKVESGSIAFGNPAKNKKVFCPVSGQSLFAMPRYNTSLQPTSPLS